MKESHYDRELETIPRISDTTNAANILTLLVTANHE